MVAERSDWRSGMKLLAFDLSLTGTAVCCAEDGKIRDYNMIPGGPHAGVARMMCVRDCVCTRIDLAKPGLVIFEGLAHNSRDTDFERAGLAWMIRAELFTDGMPFVLVAPQTLKKFICGTAGNAKRPMKKEHMLKFLATRFGHDVDSNDICDAISLAYVGMALIGEWEPKIQAQRDVIAKLRAANPSVKFQTGGKDGDTENR